MSMAQETVAASAEPGKSDRTKILVVDDDPMVRSMIAEVLTSHGYEVTPLSDSTEAIDALLHKTFPLLLLDAQLPGISGFGFFRYCRKNYPDMEVIMITGKPELEDAVSIVKGGAFDYLSKPFSVEKLIEQVKAALESRREKLSELPDLATLGVGPGNELDFAPGCEPVSGYKVIRLIGSGAMSSVFLVEREGARYALKILRDDVTDGSSQNNRLRRFLREAEILTHIDHPNIVKIYQTGFSSHGAVPFILMEYVSGRPLSALIRENSLDLEEKIRILREAAQAVAAVHHLGVLHRDIKPGNILICGRDLQVKLSDFGIAHFSGSSLTMTHEVLGSPAYMAPEAFEPGEELSLRTDIFSFGVTAYELITGVKPFHGETMPTMMKAISEELPVDPAARCSKLPASVSVILARLLRKDPADRYSSMDQVADDLHTILKNGKVHDSIFVTIRKLFFGFRDWS